MPDWKQHGTEQLRGWLRGLTAPEKQAFAQKMGVTTRTVYRWGIEPSSGKQARNFIPKRFLGKELADVPDAIRQRENTARVQQRGMSRVNPRELPTKSTEERFTNMRDALRYLRDIASGKVPKWMRHTWVTANLVRTARGWAAVIEYTTGGYAGAGVGDPSADGGGKPGDLLQIQGSDDSFGDIVYNELRGLGPGEDPLDSD